MSAAKDYIIEQGKTFNPVLRWEVPPYIYKEISAITQTAPVNITAVGHGLPQGWRVAVVSVKGMTDINASSPPKLKEFKRATVVDADNIELNEVNASEYKAYTSGGYLQFLTPVDLTGFAARMQVRDKVGGSILLELTTENGGIILDTTDCKIVLNISAADTAAITWTKGVYDLELISNTGVVTGLVSGKIVVIKEVTA